MATQEYRRAHYQAHKAKYIASAKATKDKLRQWYNEYKATLSCSKCGEAHPSCIEFHHRDPSQKDFTIGESLYRSGKRAILDEILKCDVLCSNCHRKLHYNLVMKTVKISIKEVSPQEFQGTARVRGFEIFESGHTLQNVEDRLIAALIEENEISKGNYEIEYTRTK